MLRGAIFFTFGNLMASLLAMVRAIIIARLVSVEDFGIASTFMIIVLLVEMLSQLGLELMIVQDRDGDSEKMQDALHTFQAVRGLLAGGVMYLLAGPVAALFGVPQVTWAYELLALIPVLRGFVHFDQHRMKRDLSFNAATLTVLLPAIGSIVIMFAAALLIRDHRIMLWAVLGQQALVLVVSHLVAKRRYRMAWNPALFRRAMGFGMPVLINGLLLFAIFNGERVIIGHVRGMADLAIFSMMLNLAMTPTLVLANSLQTFFLPLLARQQDHAEFFARLSHVTMQASIAIGLVLALGFALIGPPLVSALLGPKYEIGLALLVVLAIGQGVRVAKTGAAVVALARGNTANAAIGNLARVAALPIAWWWITQGGRLIDVALIAIAAEAVGFAIAMRIAVRQAQASLRPLILPGLLTAITYVLIGLDLDMFGVRTGWLEHAHWFQLVYLATGLAALASMRAAIAYAAKQLGRKKALAD